MRAPNGLIVWTSLTVIVFLTLSAIHDKQRRLAEVRVALVDNQRELAEWRQRTFGMGGKISASTYDLREAAGTLKATCFLPREAPNEFSHSLADKSNLAATLDAHPDRVNGLCDRYVADPFASDADSLAALLLTYADRSSKINIHINAGLIASLKALNPHTHEMAQPVVTLFTIGLLSWAVKHNGAAGEDEASNVAALQTVARGYACMQKVSLGELEVAERVTELSTKPGGLQAFVHGALSKR